MKTRREDAEKTTTTNGNEADNFVSLGLVEGIGTGECRYRVRDRKRGVYVLLLLLLNMQDEEDERSVYPTMYPTLYLHCNEWERSWPCE